MNLFSATLLSSIILLLVGLWFYKTGPRGCKYAVKQLRSPYLTCLTFGSAVAWFLYHVSQLTTADFGDYKGLLMILFGTVGLLAFFHAKELLSVRGIAILVLLSAKILLDAAYFQEPQGRLWLVAFAYAAIVFAMLIGAAPYWFRDILAWLGHKKIRTQLAGSICCVYSMILALVTFIGYK
jgi:hypothetical protein